MHHMPGVDQSLLGELSFIWTCRSLNLLPTFWRTAYSAVIHHSINFQESGTGILMPPFILSLLVSFLL